MSKLTAGSLVAATSGTGRAIPANHALSSSWGSILRIGVRGIGSSLLSWQIGRGRELVLSGPNDLPRYVRTMACELETKSIALYQRHGLRPVRYYDDLAVS